MDLVFRLSAFGSVCLLCGQILNPVEEPSAFRAVGGYVYATAEREVTGASGAALGSRGLALADSADSTPHGAAIEVSWVEASPKGIGAGTPALELALGVVEAFSHTEADTLDDSGVSVVNSSGNARFETFWFRGRVPFAPRHSLEAAVEIPFNRSRDLIVSGPGNVYANPERRNLYSYASSVALGYRHRGDGWESAAALRWAHASTQNGTERAYTNGTGALWGFEVELLRRFGAWRGSISGGTLQGNLRFTEGLFPEFSEETFSRRFVRNFAGIEISRPIGRTSPFFSARWVGVRTPYWDSAATLNTETLLHDQGLDYSFRSDELFLMLGLEVRVRELMSVQVAALKRFGREEVDLLPTSTNPGSGSLSISRSGWGITAGFCATVR
jgi:hypothetical protein